MLGALLIVLFGSSLSLATLYLTLDDPLEPGIEVIMADDAPVGLLTPWGLTTNADNDGISGALTFIGSVGSSWGINETYAISKPLINDPLLTLTSFNENIVPFSELVIMAYDGHFSSFNSGFETNLGGSITSVGGVKTLNRYSPTNSSDNASMTLLSQLQGVYP